MKFRLTTEFQSGSSLIADDVEFGPGTDSMVRGNVDISGTMTVTGATWTFTNEANIINYGTDLILNPGAGDLGSVVFEAPTDAPIEFDTVTMGVGQVGSSVSFNTDHPANVNTLTMIRGTVLGTSPINVAASFIWQNGNIFPGGDLTLNGDSLVQLTSSARTTHRDVINAGNFIMLGGFTLGSGAQLTNLPSGVYDIQGDSPRMSSGTFQNDGLLVRSAGAGAALFNSTDLFNTGRVEIQTGEFEFSAADYIQTAGQTILNGGNLRMANGTIPIRIDGGSLMGVGTVFGNVINDGGTVQPGLSAGEFTIDGDYDQGINGTLDIEIGGTNAGEFDVLTVTGTATLSGELRVMDIDPFVPQAGDTFVILTAAAVVGTFDTLTAPAHYEVIYSATEVTLQWTNRPSPDLNGDGLIDLKDFSLFQSCYSASGQPPSASCAVGVDADLDSDGDIDNDDYRLLFVALTQ